MKNLVIDNDFLNEFADFLDEDDLDWDTEELEPDQENFVKKKKGYTAS